MVGFWIGLRPRNLKKSSGEVLEVRLRRTSAFVFLHQAVLDSVLDRPAAEKSKKIIGWGVGSSSSTHFGFCFFAPSCDRLRRSCMVFFIEIGSSTRFASKTRVFCWCGWPSTRPVRGLVAATTPRGPSALAPWCYLKSRPLALCRSSTCLLVRDVLPWSSTRFASSTRCFLVGWVGIIWNKEEKES